jgi:hypothetical protein
MAIAIAMRIVSRIYLFATDAIQEPLPSAHHARIILPAELPLRINSGLEDTTEMPPCA